MASLTVLKTRMTEIASPVVAGEGYDLEDLVVTRVGRRLLVRITVDGEDGINLDAVAHLSRLISDGFDAVEATFGDEQYTLEVSSPGVDRPLTEVRHWRRALGRLVKTATVTGRVVEVTGDTVTLDVAGAERTFDRAELGEGRIQVEFTRVNEVFPEDVTELANDEDAEDVEDEDDNTTEEEGQQ